jgi:uncharacterized membrane protein
MQNPPPGPPPGGQPPSYPPQGGQPGYPPPGGQPPSYPPQGGQPGYPPPGGQQPGYQPMATGGVDKKTGAILSYLLGWVTGIIFLFVGKNDPDVKYHAAQSLVFFGGLTVVFWVIRILTSFLPFGVGILLGLVTFALAIYGFVVWIMCLVRASSGGGARFQIPLVGHLVAPYAEQIAAAVN